MSTQPTSSSVAASRSTDLHQRAADAAKFLNADRKMSSQDVQAMLQKNEAEIRGWASLHKQEPPKQRTEEHKEWLRKCMLLRKQIGARLEMLASLADKQVSDKSSPHQSPNQSAVANQSHPSQATVHTNSYKSPQATGNPHPNPINANNKVRSANPPPASRQQTPVQPVATSNNASRSSQAHSNANVSASMPMMMTPQQQQAMMMMNNSMRMGMPMNMNMAAPFMGMQMPNMSMPMNTNTSMGMFDPNAMNAFNNPNGNNSMAGFNPAQGFNMNQNFQPQTSQAFDGGYPLMQNQQMVNQMNNGYQAMGRNDTQAMPNMSYGMNMPNPQPMHMSNGGNRQQQQTQQPQRQQLQQQQASNSEAIPFPGDDALSPGDASTFFDGLPDDVFSNI